MEQINENGVRQYLTPEGNKYPSVTTVLSWTKAKFIAEWRSRVGSEEANRISRKATRRGTNLHSICEKYIANDDDLGSPLPDIVDLFYTIKPVIDKSIDNVYCQETKLYSDYIGIAGTVDCVAEFNNVRSIIDFKTTRKTKTKSMIHDYFMQAAGYAVMFEERTGIPVPQIVIIMTGEEGSNVFIEKRDTWINQLIETVNRYKAVHE